MGTGACFGTVLPKEQHNTEKATNINHESSILNAYTLDRMLGSGATSRVVQASHKDDVDINASLALKIMDKKRPSTQKLYRREVTVLQQLTSDSSCNLPNIVPLKSYGEDNEYCYIVTPFMSGGELFDRIITRDEKYKITETVATQLTLNMLQAVKYCHDRDVVHRDIKPENFVFANKNIDSHLVLIDFGAARIVQDDDIIDDIAGTPYYLSPEQATAALNRLKKKGKTVSDKIGRSKPRTGRILKASDVWAIGVIAFVMMTGRAPFRGKNSSEIYESTCLKTLAFPQRDVRYGNTLNLGDDFKDFIRKTLCKDPHQRMSIEDALQHKWVRSQCDKDASNYIGCVSPIPSPEHINLRRFR